MLTKSCRCVRANEPKHVQMKDEDSRCEHHSGGASVLNKSAMVTHFRRSFELVLETT